MSRVFYVTPVACGRKQAAFCVAKIHLDSDKNVTLFLWGLENGRAHPKNKKKNVWGLEA
tara:strand:+ start:427 stop:603 length:177 start_codon:yes stop_codon:yes gene_type:complete